MIDVDRIFLDLENPRHEPFEDQDAAIDYLCRQEQVLSLAKDIVENGLNPLELFALLSGGDDVYFSAEGNRRLCALKLLNDPDLAPADLRKDFEQASLDWSPTPRVFAIVFDSRDDVRLWLDRIHAGFSEGRGRRQWNAEQKARNSGYSRNDAAQILLDIAQTHEYINEEQRKGRISTVQRYISNPLMRNALGVDISNLANITTDLPEEDFHVAFKRFIFDVANRTITTRENYNDIASYANNLRNLPGVTGSRVPRHSINPSQRGKGTRARPKPPKKPTKIQLSEELAEALRRIPSYKLEKLYFSICSLNLQSHTPLLAVGAWSFLETLTALDGRHEGVDFQSYLSNQKLSELGMKDRGESKAIRPVLKRIAEFGNSTKHDRTSAAFNGEQLANDIQTIEKVMLALAERTQGKG